MKVEIVAHTPRGKFESTVLTGNSAENILKYVEDALNGSVS